MADEAMIRINEFLKKNGMFYCDVPKYRLEQFRKVDNAIQSRLKTIHEAEETLKCSKINIATISADAGISRKTFYNNKLLGEYVEEYSYDSEKESIRGEISHVKEKLDEAERRIRQFIIRDIDIENLSHENMKLNNEIQNLERRNRSLESQLEKQNREIGVLQDKLNKHQVVLEFDPNKKK